MKQSNIIADIFLKLNVEIDKASTIILMILRVGGIKNEIVT